MKQRTVFSSFFGAHIVILVVAVGFVSLYTWFTSREVFQRQWLHELKMQAKLVAAILPVGDGQVDEAEVRNFFSRLGHGDDHRYTLILPDGRVIGDTEEDASHMDKHRDRPEVIEALQKGEGMCQRYSSSVGTPMLYLARRVPAEGPVRAVVRVAVPMRLLSREMQAENRMLLVILAVVLGATLTLSYGAALRIIGPVSDLQRGLTRMGGGDLSCRLPIPAVPHLAELTRSINETADRLQKYIQALSEERNLRTLILANMTRGVIAIDTRHKVMDLNESARRLLNLKSPASEGASLGEVTRYPDLLALIDESERAESPVEREMTAGDSSEVLINMRATALKDVAGSRIGTLVVLSDVTLLRRLERVRQDFVANVSHELRTPVTSVKGFAETLLDGALNDRATAERFLKIIVRQATQLESIIRDLLDLSRLEQKSAQTIERQSAAVAGILKNALELCQARAAERKVSFSLRCEEGLNAVVHAGLIEQAVVNLVDNAIKYGTTAESDRVEVSACREGPWVKIVVRDYGAGIDRKHLDRLFERFYRVDQGRSREMGGTGLGLAIVKHIVLVHNGTVGVESALGKGTAFTVRLPA